MTDPKKTTLDDLKSTVSVRLLDPLGKSIEGLKYQIKQGEKIVAKGITDSKGNISSFVSQIGTELSLHVERFASEEMKEVRKLIPWAEDFRVKLLSGKVKEEVKFKKDAGSPGPYKRKTHIVKKGDTLGKLAVKYQTTPEAIAKLNNMKVEATIFEDQVLKIPPEKGGTAAPAASPPAAAPKPAPPVAAPKPQPPVAQDAAVADPVAPGAADPASVASAEAAPPAGTPVGEAPKTKSVPVSGPVSTAMEEARGENGTPKSTVNLKCDMSGCIKLGDTGPMVEEINIRLMGFGRTIKPPAEFDVFTENTEKAVKRFQRDYMGVPETGKVCGTTLVAIDDFKAKHPISWTGMECPCGLCTGWGHGYTDSTAAEMFHGAQHIPHLGIEHPGMHRAIIWTFRAAKFYVEVKDKALGYRFSNLSSGYRCWQRNKQTARTSTNHMGKALDLQFKKGTPGEVCRTTVLEDLKTKVFMARIGAASTWTSNRVSLEPVAIAPAWVHVDVREFDDRYLKNRFFSKTKEGADGDDLVVIARREGRLGLVNCGGIPPRAAPAAVPAAPASGRKPFSSLTLSKAGLDFIKGWEKTGPEVAGGLTIPYDDSEGYCTVGWGHLLAKKKCATLKNEGSADFNKYEKGLSKDAALALLAKDVAMITETAKLFLHVPLYEYEYDAIISLAFNTGGFKKFPKLVSKLNTGDYSGCCDEFADITNGGISGLLKRRKAEMDIFRNNHYDSRH
jgi:GH24 family phage-related lysozyme (muramidase)/LysM repeat protein